MLIATKKKSGQRKELHSPGIEPPFRPVRKTFAVFVAPVPPNFLLLTTTLSSKSAFILISKRDLEQMLPEANRCRRRRMVCLTPVLFSFFADPLHGSRFPHRSTSEGRSTTISFEDGHMMGVSGQLLPIVVLRQFVLQRWRPLTLLNVRKTPLVLGATPSIPKAKWRQ